MARGLRDVKAEIRAAAAAGDKAALAPLVAEFRQRIASADRSQKNAREGYSALEGEGGLSKFHMGMASGLVNVMRRGGQLLTPKSMEEGLGVSDKDIDEQTSTDRELASSTPGAAGRFLTEAAVTAPVAGPAGAATRLGLSALRAAPTVARLGALAAEGAAAGELTTGDPIEGAAWNAGIATGLRGLRRLVHGSKSVTPEARRLLDEGVSMTPGQMNPKGVIAQLEQGVEHVPALGRVMSSQRARLENTGLPTLFKKIFGVSFPEGTTFPEMVRTTEDTLGRAYDAVRAQSGALKPGGGWQLKGEWIKAINDPDLLVSPAARNQAAKWLQGQLAALRTKGAALQGKDLMKIRSRIREEIREAAAQGGEKADVAKILKQAEAALTGHIEAALPPRARTLLQATDEAYAQYKPLEGVADAAAARAAGNPTIGQVVTGLKRSAGQSRWSGRGAGRNQQFIEDLRDVSEKTGRPTGAILPAATFGGVLSPLLLLNATKPGSRFYAGRTTAQRAAQKAEKALRATPGVEALIRTLRRGAAGALADNPED